MGQELDLGCCNDSTPTNPKADLWQRKAHSKSMAIFDLENPIQGECEDDAKTQDFFKRWPVIPYAGSRLESGHKLLQFYIMLHKLSPTHGACINKKTAYAVGGRIKIVNQLDPVFDIPSERAEPTAAEQTQYRDALNQFFSFKEGIQKFHKNAADFFQSVGEVYIEMSISVTENVPLISLKVHDREMVLPAEVEDSPIDFFMVSKKWNTEYLKKNEPRIIPEYPEFTTDSDGVQRTMFFLKDGEYEHHGRPDSQSSDIYKYREVQDSIYVTKQAAGGFTGSLIIEVEGGEITDAIDNEGAQAAGFDSFAAQFEDNYTQRAAKPQSVLITERPYGSKPMFVHQVDPNTNEGWYTNMGDMAKGYILRSHRVTPRFMGEDTANGFSENAYLMDYMTNVEPTINTLRETITNFTNSIINSGWDFLKMPQMKLYSITFDNPIQGMIDAYKMQQTGQVSGQMSNTQQAAQ